MSGWAAVGAAAGNIIGGIATARMNQLNQQKIMQNRIQWQVGDLKRAGLNPILAATGGFGGGNQAPGNVAPDMGHIGSSAYDAMAKRQEMALKGKQIEILDTQADLNQANSAKAIAEAKVQGQQLKNLEETLRHLQADYKKKHQKGDFYDDVNKIYSGIKNWYFNSAAPALGNTGKSIAESEANLKRTIREVFNNNGDFETIWLDGKKHKIGKRLQIRKGNK